VHSELAIQYSDRSVLEHHHLAQMFTLLCNESHNFIGLKLEEFAEVRAIIIELVLQTDLSTHFAFVSKLKVLAHTHGHVASENACDADSSFGSSPGGLRAGTSRLSKSLTRRLSAKDSSAGEDLLAAARCQSTESVALWRSPFLDEDEVDASTLLVTAIKFADLGHVLKPLPLHEKWSTLISKEMWTLGDKEKAMGVAISPLCDREADKFIPVSQVGFFKYICAPFFSTVFDLVGRMDAASDNFEGNQSHWEALVAERQTPRQAERLVDIVNAPAEDGKEAS